MVNRKSFYGTGTRTGPQFCMFHKRGFAALIACGKYKTWELYLSTRPGSTALLIKSIGLLLKSLLYLKSSLDPLFC